MDEEDDFEIDARQYLDNIGKRQLNIINNILKLIKDVRSKNLIQYYKYIDDFRVIVSFKIKFLNHGNLMANEMNILNDISIEYAQLLK